MNVSFTRQAFFAFAAVLVMVMAMHVPAMAATGVGNSGKDLLDTLQGAITGNIGLFIGLLIVILGLWTWIIKQETGAGITMIIGGVLITLAPGIFTGMRNMAGGVVRSFGGTDVTVGAYQAE